MDTDPQIVEKLKELLAAIRKYPDPRRATKEWKQAYNLLKKTDAERNHVDNVVAMRGVDNLAKLIDEVSAADEPPPPPDPNAPDDNTCQKALRAFKKRLRLTRLDDESQIDARNPLSKGEASQIDQIVPPTEFPKAVWDELVRRGKLRPTGKGFYALTGQ